MKHRLPLVLLSLALLFTTGLSGKKPSPSDVQQDAPPNVIVVFVDDLGWADVGANGSAFYETPHIDRLANEGMRFTDAYAAAAICSPSRAALQTGRYPARLGITDWIRASFQGDAWQPGSPIAEVVEDSTKRLFTPRNFPYLPHEEVTLAEMLGEAGYATAHIGKWHLGPQDWWPAAQGYDENDGGNDFGQPPSYFDPYENERVQGIPNLPPTPQRRVPDRPRGRRSRRFHPTAPGPAVLPSSRPLRRPHADPGQGFADGEVRGQNEA